MRGLVLPAAVRDGIAAHAAATWPEEACGILIGPAAAGPADLRVERSLACANIAPADERRRRFEIDPRAVIETQRRLRDTGSGILGFYHSHPDAAALPSPTDLPFFRLWPHTVWLILEVRDGRTTAAPRAWWLEPDADSPVEMPVHAAAGDIAGITRKPGVDA